MKNVALKILTVLFAGAVAGNCIIAADRAGSGDGSSGTFECSVFKVADGDTLTCRAANGARHKIRLQGIDAPEKDQRYGKQSGAYLRDLVMGRKIRVELLDTDQYGRDLAVITLGGKNVNETMLATGHAWAYRHYLSGSRRDIYLGLEKEARAKKLGLWGDRSPQEPWEFRRAKRHR